MSKRLPFPEPNSMLASEAALWYRAMIPLIPKIGGDEPFGDDEWELRLNGFVAHWRTKSSLRIVAALALHDQALADEFLHRFPLPSPMEFLDRASVSSEWTDVFGRALMLLVQVSESERRSYPGTVDEAIGMELHASDGTYVMTEQGWKIKE